MKVIPIDKSVADRFVSTKHYSRNPSIFNRGYGLVEDDLIVGVVVYGQPSLPISKYAFEDRDFPIYELNRLVVQTKTKNAASFLVSNSLKMIDPKPCAVVSYADTEQGHCGIIYQATNWHYTGSSKVNDKYYMIDGELVHPRTFYSWDEDKRRYLLEHKNVKRDVEKPPKHRYFYFVGNKYQKRAMREKLKYPILDEYPKCDKVMYDDGPELEVYASSPVKLF